jgi:hypothetical protein
MSEMDRVVEKIRLEHELACNRQDSTIMLRLVDMLVQIGNQIKQKFQPKDSGCYIPHLSYREK